MTTHVNLITPYDELCHSKACWLQILNTRKIIISTLLVSTIIHAAFFIRFNGLQNEHDANKEISHSLEIVLTKIKPQQAMLEKIISPVEPPVKESQQEPELVKKVETLAEKTFQEQPIEELVKEQPQKTRDIIPQQQPLNSPTDPALINAEKEQYLKRIAAHLDKHKFYPRSAHRRHIEGTVKVSFDLLLNGNILNLYTYSGHTILQKATSDSIHNALPLPKRPESLASLNTMKIEYAMQFALKQSHQAF